MGGLALTQFTKWSTKDSLEMMMMTIRSIIKVLISIILGEITHNDVIIRLEFKTR